MTGNQCQIQTEARCDVDAAGNSQDSVGIQARVWFDAAGVVSGLGLGCQSLSDVGTDWGTQALVGGAQNGSAVLLTDRCNADQVLGGFSASSSGGLINGLQFTCTGACSEGQSADECGVCGGSGAPTWYQDVDGDGQGVDSVTVTACTQPSGYASVAGDPQPIARPTMRMCAVCAVVRAKQHFIETAMGMGWEIRPTPPPRVAHRVATFRIAATVSQTVLPMIPTYAAFVVVMV